MNMTEKIKTQRKKKGFTLKALAERVGCTDAYISQIETGKAKPSIKVLQKIAKVLEVEIRDLLNNDKQEEKFFLKKVSVRK